MVLAGSNGWYWIVDSEFVSKHDSSVSSVLVAFVLVCHQWSESSMTMVQDASMVEHSMAEHSMVVHSMVQHSMDFVVVSCQFGDLSMAEVIWAMNHRAMNHRTIHYRSLMVSTMILQAVKAYLDVIKNQVILRSWHSIGWSNCWNYLIVVLSVLAVVPSLVWLPTVWRASISSDWSAF